VNEMITVQTGFTPPPQEMNGIAAGPSRRLGKSGQSRRDRRNELFRAKCDECDARTVMVTAEQAAIITGIRAHVIYRWLESGMIHAVETPEGETLVCLDSFGLEGMQSAQDIPAESAVSAGQIDQDSVMTAMLIPRDYSTRTDAPSRAERTPISMGAGALEYAERIQGDILILRLRGSLNTVAAADFETQFQTLICGGARQFVLDCSELDRVSSAGLRTFMRVVRRLANAGGRMTLHSLGETIERDIKSMGYATMLRFFPNEEEAILGLMVTGMLPSLR
jgi:anti-anti-sigma factor